MRTVSVPGFQAAVGTRTSNWRRATSTVAVGAGVTALPELSSSSAVEPCTVRKYLADELTLAPRGQATGAGGSPGGGVNAVRSGLISVLTGPRNAVAPASGLSRSSTRSAALLAK